MTEVDSWRRTFSCILAVIPYGAILSFLLRTAPATFATCFFIYFLFIAINIKLNRRIPDYLQFIWVLNMLIFTSDSFGVI